MKYKRHSLIKASIVCVTLVATKVVFAAGAPSPFAFSSQVFVTSDDNVSRAQLNVDREKDLFLTAAGDVSVTKRIGMLQGISFVGNLQLEEFKDFTGLSNTQYGVAVDYRFQTRTGFTAPRYSFFTRYTEVDSETDIRDGYIREFGFTATRKLTTKMTGALGITDSRRASDLGEVFDLERIRYFVNLDWQITHRTAVYANYSYFDGDVFSTATPTLDLVTFADAIEPDNAFGGIDNGKFAYRLDAKTQILRLGSNIGLSPSSSFDFSVDILDSQASESSDIEYDLISMTAALLMHF